MQNLRGAEGADSIAFALLPSSLVRRPRRIAIVVGVDKPPLQPRSGQQQARPQSANL
jgi:hypothetical protein